MGISEWADSKVKRFVLSDIQFIKISVMGFTLMIAKLWEPILSLSWYWYALIFTLAAIPPFLKVFKK